MKKQLLSIMALLCLLSNAVAQAPAIDKQKCFGGKGADIGNDIIATKDGGYLIVGTTNFEDGDIIGSGFHHNPDPNLSLPDIWVAKLDKDLNIKWKKCLGGSEIDWGRAAIQTADGGFIIGGHASSTDYDVTCNGDLWLVKLDGSGNIKWNKCLGGSKVEAIGDLIESSDGGLVVVGVAHSSDGDVSGFHGGNDSDAWIVKLTTPSSNEPPTILWQRCIGGSKVDVATSLFEIQGKSFVIAGNTFSSDGDFNNFNNSDGNAFVVQLSYDGKNLEATNCYGGKASDEANCIFPTKDGGFVFAGSSEIGPLTPAKSNFWILKGKPDYSVDSEIRLGEKDNLSTFASIMPTVKNTYVAYGWTTKYFEGNSINPDIYIASVTTDLQKVNWEKLYGGSNIDETGDGQPDAGSSIIPAWGGGYIFTSNSRSWDGDVKGNHNDKNNINNDMWTVKLEPEPDLYPISGPASLCLFSTGTYSVNFNSPNNTTWSVSSPNLVIIGPNQGNSITVEAILNFPSSTGTITATNGDYTSSFEVTIISPAQSDPGPISGPNGYCPDEPDGGMYSIDPVPGAVSYSWTVQGSADLIPSTSTKCFAENIAGIFTISVKANGVCGTSNPSSKLVFHYSKNAPECGVWDARSKAGTEIEKEKIDSSEKIENIYPNPAHDILNLQLTAELISDKTKLTIFDSIGRTIWNGKYEPQVDISSLPTGLYILVAQSEIRAKQFQFVKK